MINILNLIAFLLLFGLLIFVSYHFIITKKKLVESSIKNLQSMVDINILSEKIEQLVQDKKLVESSEFMSFLNTSRDHAFTYIELVQDSLNEYKKMMDPIIEYHETYGTVLGETPQWTQMEQVSKAYKELLTILPKENG